MTGLSAWAIYANECLSAGKLNTVFEYKLNDYIFSVVCSGDSLWIVADWPDNCRMVFRPVYSPEADLTISGMKKSDTGVRLTLNGCTGKYTVEINFLSEPDPLIRYTTRYTASLPLLVPFWPKDVLVLNTNHPHIIKGNIHVKQEGARSGLIYFSTESGGGTVLYMQDLSSLGDYCQATETSAAGLVGGTWPEIGFSLPVSKGKPLPAGKEYIISDAYVVLTPEVPRSEIKKGKQFLNLLAAIYRRLPLPPTNYINYPEVVKKSVEDIKNNYGCWLQIDNKSYINAYVCDYKTPPELMVQLAVLLPVLEYQDWAEEETGLEEKLRAGIPEFYDPQLQTLARWLPAAEGNLDKSEEQKKEKVMDSWYLHHPLLNISRLALRGSNDAKKLFLDSLGFVIKVAHHFKYEWPVFYHMQTLEVIKAETTPGNGGEKDVAGLYANVMLQAWELTREKRYLDEAKKAAKTLEKQGLELFYQANNTAFSAKAMLRLYKETKDELYLDLSYLCLASMMRNMHIWTCNYGYARNYPTFFALYPLNDAPYTAPYEEQEVFASYYEYLQMADGIDILPSVSLLLSEFTRHFINRAAFYFPPFLPDEVLSKEVKTGEISRNLHLALEDLQDGWEKSGSVGQEVYGAGLAFGVVPRSYIKVPGNNFMVFIDYPVVNIRRGKDKLTFKVLGEAGFTCRMMILKAGGKALPEFTIKAEKQKDIKANKTKDRNIEYMISGNQKLSVSW